MAFDGFTTAALAAELSRLLTGGRISRIIQPETDELLLTVRPPASAGGGQIRLVLCADASLPLVYLTDENRPAPDTAPAFCMLLRKYLLNGRLARIAQPGLERILRFEVEHYNEMGDLCRHTLVIELMGKHSNIILTTDASAQERILDAIKHIPSTVSSVREVLPGRPYFVPQTQGKCNPLAESEEHFLKLMATEHLPAPEFLLRHYTGFSVRMSEETVFRAHLLQDRCVSELGPQEAGQLWSAFRSVLGSVSSGQFSPTVYYHVGAAGVLSQGEPVDYSALPLTMFRNLPEKHYESMSALIRSYYREKNAVTRIRQKSADLRHIVQTILERDLHKYDLQQRQLKDTEKREKYRIYGELLNACGYDIPEGADRAVLENYYTGEPVTIPLDPRKSVRENAQHYYGRYAKLKRTRQALEGLTEEVRLEILQLENIRAALDLSVTEGDLKQIRQEMIQSGFLRDRNPDGHAKGAGGGRTQGAGKRQKAQRAGKSGISGARPLHYLSSDGYDIYVGKNNLQNDELTFHFARPEDIWLHANDRPGSHVILRAGGKAFGEIPDRTFEEAARLAAYYSTGRDAGRTEVDYLERRGVKKPSGARPGYVIYHSNYSILVNPDISGIPLCAETAGG